MTEHDPIPERTNPVDGGDAAGGAHEGGTTGGEGAGPGRRRWLLAALGALAVALFAVPLLRGPEPGPAAGAAADRASSGDNACVEPANLDYTLTSMDGSKVRLTDYKGQVILLNFWATWCGPCKIEIPDFVDVYNQYRDRGLVVLGVLSLDEPSEDELRAFADEYKMTYPVFRADDDFAEANGPLFGLPTTLVIDRQGSICARHMGMVTRETVEREIKGLL